MCCFEPKQEKQAVMDVAYCNLLKGSIGRVCGYRHGTVYHNEPVTVKTVSSKWLLLQYKLGSQDWLKKSSHFAM